MKILFSTGSLYFLPIRDVFNLAREAGFDGCELVIDRRFLNPQYLDIVMECTGVLPIYSVHSPFMSMKPWGTQEEILARTVEISKTLGASVVNFHPPSWFAMEVAFLKWFRRIDDFQKKFGCRSMFLTIENMPLSGRRLMLAPYFLNSYEDLLDFGVKRNLCFTLDTTHLATFGKDVIVTFLAFFETGMLKNVHLSDFSASESHLFLGRGELPIVKLLNTMRRMGYEEMLTLEVGPQEWPATGEWLLKMLRYQLSFLKLHLGEDMNG
jgi:sugar phosphate isomerase/epimerase